MNEDKIIEFNGQDPGFDPTETMRYMQELNDYANEKYQEYLLAGFDEAASHNKAVMDAFDKYILKSMEETEWEYQDVQG